jgi:alpha-ribazole phosphatase
MMQTLYLIRHGQSQTNAGGITLENPVVPLTELGERQAQRVATLLPATTDHVCSSPFKRALDTAAPYCARVARTPAIHADLREFEMIDTAQMSGGASAERELAMARYWLTSDPDQRTGPSAETFREFHARVARVRSEYLPALPPGSVIFGHGIWMALLFWQIWGFETIDGPAMTRFRRFQLGFPTPNTAVYRLTHIAPGKWDVRADEGAMHAIAALGAAPDTQLQRKIS